MKHPTPYVSTLNLLERRSADKLIKGSGYVLWCLILLSKTFQLCRGVRMYWWRKSEKTTGLPEVTVKLSHILT